MRSHLDRRRVEPTLVVGSAVCLLLLLGVLLVVFHGESEVALAPTDPASPGNGLGATVPDLSELGAVDGAAAAADATAAAAGDGVTAADGTADVAAPPAEPAAAGSVPPPAGQPAAPGAPAEGQPADPAAPAAAPPAAPSTPSPATTTLTPQTCFDGAAETVRDIQPLPCEGSHSAEIYVVLSAPGEPGAPYPGEQDLLERTGEVCRGSAFDDYVGVPWANSRFFTSPVVPSETTWADGDRVLACFLYDLNGQREGSARGSMM